MKININSTDRIIRVIIAAIVAALYFIIFSMIERSTSILAAFRSSQKDFLDISIPCSLSFLSQFFEVHNPQGFNIFYFEGYFVKSSGND